MQTNHLSYQSHTVHFLSGGQGKNLVLCFHGYGESAESFSFLEKYAGHDHLFIAIDLPFHGETKWNGYSAFTVKDLTAIVTEIIARFPAAEKIMVMGYSMGGRIALSLYQSIPQRISKLILLAPDGLKVNFWYWLSTQTWLGNKFFRFTMKHPDWFFGFLKLLNKLGMVNASIFKFVNYYIGDKTVRENLYNRWTVLRKLKPRIPAIKSMIRENKTRTRLVYGEHDRIILPVRGEQFRKGIEDICILSVIHSGHQVLSEKHIDEILPVFYD